MLVCVQCAGVFRMRVVAVNPLAFAFHTVGDWLETLWENAREAIGA